MIDETKYSHPNEQALQNSLKKLPKTNVELDKLSSAECSKILREEYEEGELERNSYMLNVEEWTETAELISYALTLAKTEEGLSLDELLNEVLEFGSSLTEFEYVKFAINYAIKAPKASSLTNPDDPLDVPYWGRYFMYWSDTHTHEELVEALILAGDYAKKALNNALEASLTEDHLTDFDINMKRQLGLIK